MVLYRDNLIALKTDIMILFLQLLKSDFTVVDDIQLQYFDTWKTEKTHLICHMSHLILEICYSLTLSLEMEGYNSKLLISSFLTNRATAFSDNIMQCFQNMNFPIDSLMFEIKNKMEPSLLALISKENLYTILHSLVKNRESFFLKILHRFATTLLRQEQCIMELRKAVNKKWHIVLKIFFLTCLDKCHKKYTYLLSCCHKYAVFY